MTHTKMLEGLENLHSVIQEAEQSIKNEFVRKGDEYPVISLPDGTTSNVPYILQDLLTYVETMREPLFDLVNSGKTDK